MASTAERCQPCEDGRKLLALGLLVRVAWGLWAHKFWGYSGDGAYDDGAFIDFAKGLLAQGPVAATHPPGYPLFLVPFMVFGDVGISLARWAQMLLSAATAVLAYRLAFSLQLSRRAALIAGAFIALHPMLVYFSVRMMSETLFAALVVAFFLAWLRAWQCSSFKAAALAGFLGGAATLTRGIILPFGGVLALVAFWRRKEQPRWKELVAVCGLVWALTLVPWTARNARVYGRFIPVSVQGGWNFYEGLTVDPDEIRYKRAMAMGEEARALGLDGAFAIDAYFGAKAKAWIRSHPGAFFRLCAIKAARFWRLAPERPYSTSVRLGTGLFTFVLFAAALLGLRRAASVPGAWFLFAWGLHLTLLHAVFASNLRYRLPFEPILAVLAGAGLAALSVF